jgi:hypothetical protein
MTGDLIVAFAFIGFIILAPIVWPASPKMFAGKRRVTYLLLNVGVVAAMLIVALVAGDPDGRMNIKLKQIQGLIALLLVIVAIVALLVVGRRKNDA